MKKKIFSIIILFVFCISVFYAEKTTVEKLRDDGCEFFYNDVITVEAGDSRNILINYSAHTSGLKQIIAIPATYFLPLGSLHITVYTGTDYTGGTDITFLCTRPSTGNTLETEVSLDATGSTLGTIAQEYDIGASETNQNSGGGSFNFGIEIILDNTIPSGLIVIENDSATDYDLTLLQIFYEY